MNRESGIRNSGVRWWGWGYLDKTYPLEERPAFWPYLRRRLGLDGEEGLPVPDLDAIELRPPRLEERALAGLREIVGEENVSTGKYDRLTHAYGKSYPDLVRLRKGQVENPPDVVVYPESEREVAAILRLAEEERLAVIPFGGGTSVVGGVEPLAGELRGAISLDLRKLNALLEVDEVSLTATAQAGISGPELEEALNRRGYTLGHFPQSFEFSTLGGWIAARAAGQQSTKYGKIEDMVVSLVVVTPRGAMATKRVPASASGPDLDQLLVGSEGILGVITQATVIIRPLPQVKDYRGVLFRDFGDGLEAIREIMQRGVIPATIRLSDEEETRAYVALQRPPVNWRKALKEKVGKAILTWRGYSLDSGCLMVLGLEGEEVEVKRERREALAICRRHGGFHLGRGPGRGWYKERFELPYLRDILLSRGVMVIALETATTWDNLEYLYRQVKKAIESAIEGMGVKPLVMTHASHVYRSGASLYYLILAKQLKGRELEQWRAIKRAATECIVACGGTLSHHHGVGRDHAPWLVAEHGELGVEAIKALKRALDPAGIMNPGKVLRL